MAGDGLAAVIIAVMVIPQSLAYALLADLPPVIGLYASLLPLGVYAVFGTSSTLSVGPVAVLALMTATALEGVAAPGSKEYVAAAALLALLSGLMLLAMGFLRLGFLANPLSHPVVAGFITASAILIAVGQAGDLAGVDAAGHSIGERLVSLTAALPDANPWTLAVGLGAVGFLVLTRSSLAPLLVRTGLSRDFATLASRLGPVMVVIIAILLAMLLDLEARGVAVVGTIPEGLPPLGLPSTDLDVMLALEGSAALICFVESISLARSLAAKRHETVDPDAELRALGVSNLSAALSGGFPVVGGFARSVMNFDAGARTPAAGAYTALSVFLAITFLTPLLHHLPIAVLAATIVVTLVFGVEQGILAGVALSLLLLLWRASRPHIAVVGRVPGTEHFRNVLRHGVETDPTILSVRPDGSLFFANAGAVQDFVLREVARHRPDLRHVVLLCSAVNEIDLSALEMLEEMNERLRDKGLTLHLSEVKGPVMDRLKRSRLLKELGGRVFLSQSQAIEELEAHAVTARDEALA